MAKVYRSDSLEEEPLTGNDGEDEAWTITWKTDTERNSLSQRLQRLSPHWVLLGHALLLLMSLTFFALSFCVKSAKLECPEQVPTTWSPALESVKYEIQRFDLPPVPTGPFVGKGPEVDASWDYITNSIGDTMVSREEMIKMKLDPEGALEITDPATGKPGFRVAIEVFHQLHCLDLLRQNNYKSHYSPLGGDTAAEPEDLNGHLDHCIDALRQFVMCQGDVNVFAFRYPFNDGDPWPDYTTPHMCRNYESIRQWAVNHTVERGPDEPEH